MLRQSYKQTSSTRNWYARKPLKQCSVLHGVIVNVALQVAALLKPGRSQASLQPNQNKDETGKRNNCFRYALLYFTSTRLLWVMPIDAFHVT